MQLLRAATPLVFTLAAAASGLHAQVVSIPDADASSGVCSFAPFGTDGTSFRDQRYQLILRASELPTQTALLGNLRFAPCGSGRRSFNTIKIEVAQLAAGTTPSPTFEDNLANERAVLLDAENFTWDHLADTWANLELTSGYLYPGGTDLVIDIDVTGAALSSGANGFHRSDTVERLAGEYVNGQPPTTAQAVDTFGLKVQLEFVNAIVVNTIEGSDGCPTRSTNEVPELFFAGEVRPRSHIFGTPPQPRVAWRMEYGLRNAPADTQAFLVFSASRAVPPGLELGNGCNFTINPAEIVLVQNVTTDMFGNALPDPLFLEQMIVPSGAELLFQYLVFDRRVNNFNLATTARGVSQFFR